MMHQFRADTPHPFYYKIKYIYFLSGAMRCCEIAIFLLTGYFLATHYHLASMLTFFFFSVLCSLILTYVVDTISDMEDNEIDTINWRMAVFLNDQSDTKLFASHKNNIWQQSEKLLDQEAYGNGKSAFVPYFYYLFIDFMCVFGAMWNVVDEINRWVLSAQIPQKLSWLTAHTHLFLLITLPLPILCLWLKFKYTRRMFVMRKNYQALQQQTQKQLNNITNNNGIKPFLNHLKKHQNTEQVEQLLTSCWPIFWHNNKNFDGLDIYLHHEHNRHQPCSNLITDLKHNIPNVEQNKTKPFLLIKWLIAGFFATSSAICCFLWIPSLLPNSSLTIHVSVSLLAFIIVLSIVERTVHLLLRFQQRSTDNNIKQHQCLQKQWSDQRLIEYFDLQQNLNAIGYAKLAISIYRYQHHRCHNGKQLKHPLSFFQAVLSYLIIPTWNLLAIAFPIVFNLNIFMHYLFGIPTIFSAWTPFIIEGLISLALAGILSYLRTHEHFRDLENFSAYHIIREMSFLRNQHQDLNHLFVTELPAHDLPHSANIFGKQAILRKNTLTESAGFELGFDVGNP